MIRVCYYRGCGVVYGEKEPRSDTRITHGVCPKHLKISLKEIKAQMGKSSLFKGWMWMRHPLTPTEEDPLGKVAIEGDGVRWWKALLKWTDTFCRQKGVEHALDHICDSLNSVAVGIYWWLCGWWTHSYPAGHRRHRLSDPTYSGTKMIVAIWTLAGGRILQYLQ